MIEYRYPEEKQLLLHYAQTLGYKDIETILSRGDIDSPEEAKKLARFFWIMVDQTVADQEQGIPVIGHNHLEHWCESIMQSFRNYFTAAGYMDIWEQESDND